MIVEQDLSDVVIGTYVIKIIEQEGRFKLPKSGWIKNQASIDQFKAKGIKRVLIDTSKQREIQKEHAAKDDFNFLADLSQAKKVFKASKDIQQKLFADAKEGTPLDLGPVRNITDESIDIIFKNPDALACIITIRQKDEYLLEHSIAVSILMTIFAHYLKIDKEIIRELAVGAFLHDVGKIMIPDDILNKPGRLTEQEFEVMKTHVTHSINSITNTPGISKLSLEVAAQHHEKLDGNGYPNNLKAEEVSHYGRMISICDIFDALTANRCYKAGFPQVKAFSILRALANENQLDSVLVDSFIKCIGVYPVGSLVKLDSDKLAIVEQRNKNDSIRPKVKAFYNLNDNSFEMPQGVDLSTSKDEQIVKCVRADDFDLNIDEIIEYLANEA